MRLSKLLATNQRMLTGNIEWKSSIRTVHYDDHTDLLVDPEGDR